MLEDKNRVLYSYQVYLILELCGGMTLSQFCRTRPQKRLSDDEAFTMFYPILKAVHYLHSWNIAHRDLKLTNVLVDRDLRVKLIDFGFSDNSGRMLHAYCGTPSYMAPAIVLKKEYSGSAVDVWALGVILFKMLTGEYAFGSRSR
jgi:serine/threonine protein kinase